MREDIKQIEDEVDRLKMILIELKHSCPHENSKIFKGMTSGGYYDDSENYIYLKCYDCGLSYTYYEGDDNQEYKKLLQRL